MANEGSNIVPITSYPRREVNKQFWEAITVHEAARATSAATSFFKPLTVEHRNITRIFSDGRLGANNPIDVLWEEAQKLYGEEVEPKLRMLLSIGTGVPPLTTFPDGAKAVVKAIVDIATETEKTAARFDGHHRALARRGGYLRFNVRDISMIQLDDAEEKGTMATRTAAYMDSWETRTSIETFATMAGEELSASHLESNAWQEFA